MGLRTSLRFSLAFACTTAIGLILAVTLFGRMLELSSGGNGVLTTTWLTDSALWSDALVVNRSWLLNFGLFVPAGFFCSLAFRQSIAPIVYLTGLAITIEFVQRWTMLGTADPADLIANFSGATIGGLCALGLRRIVSMRSETH